MNFYDILQKDPIIIKQLMQDSSSQKERRKLKIALFIRSLLIVLFAIAFIAPLSSIFGNENSAMAVAIFCILLSIRFVDFGYCIQDSLFNLAILFFLLFVSPILAYFSNPLLALIIHFVSFFIILMISCEKEEMGNAALYSFAYVFLSGNPVSNEAFFNRFKMTCVGLIICGIIFFFKHKNKYKDIRFITKLKNFTLYSHKYQWEIKMAFGISIILSIGSAFHLERFMWAGFACGSLLSEHTKNPKLQEKLYQRLLGTVLGCTIFFFLYTYLPPSIHILIGPIGGFCLGLSTQYKYKTAINCLGALLLASSIYGVHSAIILRMIYTVFGAVFAFFFYYFYDYIIGNKFTNPSSIKK